MSFSDSAALLREICNGIMCMSALILIMIFVDYVIRYCRHHKDCLQHVEILAAVAIVILLSGHAIRAFTGWMQFVWLRHDWDSNYWNEAESLFLAATALIIVGKILMVYTFTPPKWSNVIVAGMVFTIVSVPILVAIAM